MGFDNVATVRSPLQPAHPKSRNPRLRGTTQQSHDTVELGNVTPEHRTAQVENEIRLKRLYLPELVQIHNIIIYIYI